MSYYAVKKGRVPGIYNTWKECQKQILKFSGAQFHKFETIEECEQYVKGSDNHSILNNEIDKSLYLDENLKYPLAFIDGSNNKKTKAVGYGIVLAKNEGEELIEISGLVEEKYWFSNNVSGEIQSAIEAIKYALKENWKSLTIYYDYSGIELWGNGIWRSKLELSNKYIELCKEARNNGLEINFIKIPSHTGVKLNDRADYLAASACGVYK